MLYEYGYFFVFFQESSMKVRAFLRVILTAAVLFGIALQASAENRWVKVVNQSSYVIWYVYGTNAGDTKWGRDRLGGEIIYPGYEIKINFTDGSNACLFDLRAETKSGTKYWNRMGANVCTLETWTLND